MQKEMRKETKQITAKNKQNTKVGSEREKKRNKIATRHIKNNKMVILSPCQSIITLNRLKSSIKRLRLNG